jgi:hypothetical protein
MNSTMKAITGSFAALSIASCGWAQEHRGTIATLEYGSYDYQGVLDIDAFRIGAASDFAIGGAFGVQGALSYEDADDSGANTGSRFSWALHPYYEFSEALRVGAFYQRSSLDIGATYETTYYGAEAMFSPVENMTVEVYLGGGEIPLFPDADLTSYGLGVSYAFGPNLVGRASYEADELEAGPSFDYSNTSVGLDYHFGGGSAVPLILSLDYGQDTNFTINQTEWWALGVSIPLGGTAGASGRKLFGERGALEWYPLFSF